MITYFIILTSIQIIQGTVYMAVNFNNKTEVDLYNKYLEAVCKGRREICKVDHKIVCAVRRSKGVFDYKEFENSCQVFMHNFCDFPESEYHIVTTGKCKTYLKSRRNGDPTEKDGETSTTEGEEVTTGGEEITTEEEVTTAQDDIDTTSNTITTMKGNTTKPNLRKGKKNTTKFVPLYEVDTAFDDHLCPHSCPDTYSPVCVSANRGNGMYFKFWTFVNHCSGDLFYCKNPDEFEPPPDESAEDVNASKLGWSYCGASRYLQFARFSESTSSLGYYGWLSGNQKYSHIMEPHERKPGYG